MHTAESMVHSQVEETLYRRFGQQQFTVQATADSILTLWVPRSLLLDVLQFLKPQFSMLYDLFAIDERTRQYRSGQPDSDFTVVYQLLSMERNDDIRIKVALSEADLHLPTIIGVWPNANWYEREAWDMFGVIFDGHPTLYRILLPPTWEGHALRKDHPARATEMAPFEMGPERVAKEQEALRFRPEEWGMEKATEDSEYMFLNLGPNHPSVHGVFRVALQLDGEVIIDSVPDIGYHHRGAEKMGERQTWHTYIPYTDRIDYLGGVMNNLAYIQSVEMLGGVIVPERAKIIRIMLSELFRISSHLVFYGTFVQDVGQMSPVFYMFADRERLFGIIEAITGGRMHPAWFRIGGVAQDLPEGWDTLVRDFIDFLPLAWIITTRWPCRTRCLRIVQLVLVFIPSKKPLTGALQGLVCALRVAIGMYVKSVLMVGMISLTSTCRFHITGIVMTALNCALKKCDRAYELSVSA